MTKFKGTQKVKVYWFKNPNPDIGGSMTAIGNYLGHLYSPGWFRFDEELKCSDGQTRLFHRRVSNVKSPGIYKKNVLVGP